MKLMKCYLSVIGVVTAFSGIAECANYEVNTKRGNIPGYYIRSEMQEADRAVEAARSAGKDKVCPAEFKAAEDAKNKAYDVFRACHTEEGADLAKKATAMANALCPPPVVAPAPAPPAPPAPSAQLTVNPQSIQKGAAAKLNWNSQNATECSLQPSIGTVQPTGSMSVSPDASTDYKLACNGAGGSVESIANLNVVQPPPDSDRDGVIDSMDKCPNTPLGTKVDKVGCPVIECKSATIDINFDTDKFEIKPEHHAELDKVAEKMKKFPKATAVIEGHTDNVGTAAYNKKLSNRRAEAVKKYLQEKQSIAAKRLAAKGFGDTKPIASNSTEADRAKNRRVESVFTCPE